MANCIDATISDNIWFMSSGRIVRAAWPTRESCKTPDSSESILVAFVVMNSIASGISSSSRAESSRRLASGTCTSASHRPQPLAGQRQLFAEPLNVHQRGAQVVRDHVGKVLQLAVAPLEFVVVLLQLGGRAFEFFAGPHSLGDVIGEDAYQVIFRDVRLLFVDRVAHFNLADERVPFRILQVRRPMALNRPETDVSTPPPRGPEAGPAPPDSDR